MPLAQTMKKYGTALLEGSDRSNNELKSDLIFGVGGFGVGMAIAMTLDPALNSHPVGHTILAGSTAVGMAIGRIRNGLKKLNIDQNPL